MVFDSTAAKLYVTLSSSVTREYAVSGTTLTFGQDFTMSGAAPFGVAITPDDSRLLVTDISSNNQVIPVNLGTATVETALAGGTTPLTPVITTDGKRAVVVNVGGTDYSLFDVAASGVTAHSPTTLNLGAPPGEIALAPDGPIGLAGATNLVVGVNGNTLEFIKYDAGTGGLALGGFTTGPFAQSLKKVAVVPAR
jgi:DNA-binding beta-propeller fold protein YncE